ncbi:MAG: putative aminotransferase [Alphaproteobacteria bacterium MarineAlpha5_Bin9]|nr:MAG: putative aminotransferase [Alphaproteobacteria bacterium MarineAlpha5_Bin9]|tara:strand:+ start:16964 stop:18301 length:1338 start_codon:yes stop_codon:yes gene_type:complete
MNYINESSHFYGFTDLKSLEERGPLVISHGEGIYVYDKNNRKYLDANSGLWNACAGFDHPGLIEVAKDQYNKFAGYHSLFGRLADVVLELSEKIIEVSPFDSGKVFFTNSGSEANDTAVKILWMINKRKNLNKKRKIITRTNSYHGVTLAASSMTGKPYNKEFGLPNEDFIHTDCPHYWKYRKENESEEEFSIRLGKNLETLILNHGEENIAGFFAEPVIGAGGVIPPPKNYFEIIQKVLKNYNIPFIADEVICGFGRTGNLWGSQTYNIDPDVIISSKCLTCGFFPMGAVIMKKNFADELLEVSKSFEEFPHGFTSGGHPVGCAIALKSIDVITKEGLLDKVREISPYFLTELKKFDEYENIGEVRGVGLMAALEIVKDKKNKTYFESNISIGEKVANKSLDNGLICRPIGPSIVLCPQFIITKKEIDFMFEMLNKTLKSVFKN